MNHTLKHVRVLACVAVLFGSLAVAQAAVGKAVVRSVSGAAEYSEAGSWKALKAGTELQPGAQVRTGNDASVVLFLDQNGPLVQLTENTTLAIEKLNYTAGGVDTTIETVLNVKAGRIMGYVKKLSGTSKYEVKTPSGVAGIRGTDYLISADGTVNVVAGQVVVVFVKSDGSVVTQVVNEGQMFNPATQKVEPIPSDRLADYQQRLSAMKGGVVAEPEAVEPAPIIRISPVR
jgi:hypothetical protein